jgi:hypothetical protein
MVNPRRARIEKEAGRTIWRRQFARDDSIPQIDNTVPASAGVTEFSEDTVRKFVDVVHTNWTHRSANVPSPMRSLVDITTNGCGGKGSQDRTRKFLGTDEAGAEDQRAERKHS